VCPQETGDATLHVNPLDGYCLLLPAGFAVDPDFPARFVGGPELGPAEGFDSVRASLGVGVYALGEQTPEQALQPISEQIDASSVQTTTIAGYPAVVYDFTGGPWRQRNAQIVVGDQVYTFVGQPWDEVKFPEALADVETLWNTTVDSIAFFDRWR
jgi:predicted Zn-dependent protease